MWYHVVSQLGSWGSLNGSSALTTVFLAISLVFLIWAIDNVTKTLKGGGR